MRPPLSKSSTKIICSNDTTKSYYLFSEWIRVDFKAFSAEIVGVQDNATRNMIICRVTIIQLIAGPTVVGLSEQPYSWQADISLATMLEFKPKEIELAQYMEATWYTFQGIDYNLYGKTRATIHIIRGGGGGAGVDGGHTLELSWEIEPEEDVVVTLGSLRLNNPCTRNVMSNLDEWLNVIINDRRLLQLENATMKTALSSAQGNLQKSMDKNEEWIRFKQEQETVQFVKFRELLNAKKKKCNELLAVVRHLQANLETSTEAAGDQDDDDNLTDAAARDNQLQDEEEDDEILIPTRRKRKASSPLPPSAPLLVPDPHSPKKTRTTMAGVSDDSEPELF